jgi:hypothetical protein
MTTRPERGTPLLSLAKVHVEQRRLMRGARPLILRILLSSVPWWAALTCNVLAAAALVLLALDSHGSFLVAALNTQLQACSLRPDTSPHGSPTLPAERDARNPLCINSFVAPLSRNRESGSRSGVGCSSWWTA